MVLDIASLSGRSTRSQSSRRSSRKKKDMSSRDLEDLDRTVAALFLSGGAPSPIAPVSKKNQHLHTIQTDKMFDQFGNESNRFSMEDSDHDDNTDFQSNFFSANDSKVENWAIDGSNHSLHSSHRSPIIENSSTHVPEYDNSVEYFFGSGNEYEDKSTMYDSSTSTVSSKYSLSRRNNSDNLTKKKRRKKKRKKDRKSRFADLELAVTQHVLASQRDLCTDYSSDKDEFSVTSNITSDDILHDLSDVDDDFASQCSSRISANGSLNSHNRKPSNRKLETPNSRNNQIMPALPIVESPSRDDDEDDNLLFEKKFPFDEDENDDEDNSDGHLQDLLQVLAVGGSNRSSAKKSKSNDLFAEQEEKIQTKAPSDYRMDKKKSQHDANSKSEGPLGTSSTSAQRGSMNNPTLKPKVNNIDEEFDPFGISHEEPWGSGQVLDVSFDDPFGIDPTSSVSLTSSCGASSQDFWGDENIKESITPTSSSSKANDFFNVNKELDKQGTKEKKNNFSNDGKYFNERWNDTKEPNTDSHTVETANETFSLPSVDTKSSEKNVIRQPLNVKFKDFKSDNSSNADFDPFQDSELKIGSNRKLWSSIKPLMKRSSTTPASEGMRKLSSAKNVLMRQTSHRKTVSEPLLAAPFTPERGWETFINEDSAWSSENFTNNKDVSSSGTSTEKNKNSHDYSKDSSPKKSNQHVRVRTIKLSSPKEATARNKERMSNSTSSQSHIESRDDLKNSPAHSSANLSTKSEDAASDIEPRVLFGDMNSSFSSSKDASDDSNISSSNDTLKHTNENIAPWFDGKPPPPPPTNTVQSQVRRESAVVGRKMKERLNENFKFGNFKNVQNNFSTRQKTPRVDDFNRSKSPTSVL